MEISELKTGMIVELKVDYSESTKFAMVLLNTGDGDTLSGQTWKPLRASEFYDEVVRVYQPTANMHYLNKPLEDLCGKTLIWEKECPNKTQAKQLRLEAETLITGAEILENLR